MTFIALPNFKSMLAAGSTAASKTATDKNGTSKTLYCSSGSNMQFNVCPFWASTDGKKTATNLMYCLPYASSTSSIPSDTTSILNQVGTTDITYSRGSKGWTAIITVTATEGTKINSFFFVKKLSADSAQSNVYEAVIYAIKLDNEVTIDSTGTANFTFAIEF